MFQNRKIYICTLGMALTLYMSGIAFIRSDGDSANLQDAFSVVSSSGFIILFYLLCVIGGGLSYCQERAEGPKAPSPGRALKKVPNFKLHSLFLNFNSCPRSISSFKSGILFWTGI